MTAREAVCWLRGHRVSADEMADFVPFEIEQDGYFGISCVSRCARCGRSYGFNASVSNEVLGNSEAEDFVSRYVSLRALQVESKCNAPLLARVYMAVRRHPEAAAL